MPHHVTTRHDRSPHAAPFHFFFFSSSCPTSQLVRSCLISSYSGHRVLSYPIPLYTTTPDSIFQLKDNIYLALDSKKEGSETYFFHKPYPDPFNPYVLFQNWLAFNTLHRPLFTEHNDVSFQNRNLPSKNLNFAFCKVSIALKSLA